MKPLTFNYDEINDSLLDANGLCIMNCFKGMNYAPVENGADKLDVKQVNALKDSGFDAKEIIEMFKSGVI